MKDIYGYMLGPKAENLDFFKKLLNEAIDDHLYWRRNYQPLDEPIITSERKRESDYIRFEDKFSELLSRFLSESKKGVPFFSPRYFGHMNTDLLLPGLLGYFGAMLYNNNNVAGESSPVTVQLESEVINFLNEMVGYDTNKSWGYLTSGGTSANLFSVWLTRNLRTYPFAIRLAINLDDELNSEVQQVSQLLIKSLYIETAKGINKKLQEATPWELANIPINSILKLRQKCVDLIMDEEDLSRRAKFSDEEDSAQEIFDKLIQPFQVKVLGVNKFINMLETMFGSEETEFLRGNWFLFTPVNKHYSWVKSMDISGLGNDNILSFPLDHGFDVDADSIEHIILDSVGEDLDKPKNWPLFVASTFGSTEEGAIDDLPKIHKILDKIQKDYGITLWHHVDACYGGYLATLFRSTNDAKDNNCVIGDFNQKNTLKYWLKECALASGIDEKTAEELIDMSEHGNGWLSWEEFSNRARGLSLGDSISIDPHKMGYIPYPCGTILLKNKTSRNFVSSNAPYLWSDAINDYDLTGQFTLEGSRPGVAASSCWLAHSLIPLDQDGHGKLVALTILATRKLYLSLFEANTQLHDDSRVAILHQPHSNILCYVPYNRNLLNNSLDVNTLTDKIIEKLHPTRDYSSFIVVSTVLNIRHALSENENSWRSFIENTNGESIKALRSVVMNPYALNAYVKTDRNENPKNVFEAFSQYLLELISNEYSILYKELIDIRMPPQLYCLFIDDDELYDDAIKEVIPEFKESRFSKNWKYYSTEKDAIEYIDDTNNRIDVVFLDIDMSKTGGSSVGGYDIYRKILERNNSVIPDNRVKGVFFLTGAYLTHHDTKINKIYEQSAGNDDSIMIETIQKEMLGSNIEYDDKKQHITDFFTKLLNLNFSN